MQVLRGIPPLAARMPCVLTIGNFDGVHRGHQALLARVVDDAHQLGVVPALMTFEPQPREFFAPATAPARIASLRDKVDFAHSAGIERVYVQHFDRRLAGFSADQFIDQILVAGCRVRKIVVGADFRFGARRAGDVAHLRRRGAGSMGSGGSAAGQARFEVDEMPTVSIGADRVSSSAIRAALQAGQLDRAAQLLGRPYSLGGRVLHGARIGRGIGFPTLNLRVGGVNGVPPALRGIYAVRVHGLAERSWPGVASIGVRPTVVDGGRWLLEVHLFDFERQVYGALVRVEFVRHLRDEQKFDTLDELGEAIRSDAERARLALAQHAVPALHAAARR